MNPRAPPTTPPVPRGRRPRRPQLPLPGGTGPTTTSTETGCEPTQWYADADTDGFGDPAAVVQACTAPPGHVDNGDDCNDAQAGINPDQPELCNEVDDDCDGVVDEYSEQNVTCNGCLGHVDGSFVYYVCSGNLAWQQARADCQTKATDLVSITSEAEDALVAGLVAQHMPGDAWIGLYRDGVNAPFIWSDGTRVDYTNWRTDEPANTSQEIACCELDTTEGGVWNDVDCSDAFTADAWICKGPVP